MTPKITWVYHLDGKNLYRSRKWHTSRRYYYWGQRYYTITTNLRESEPHYGEYQWIPCCSNWSMYPRVVVGEIDPNTLMVYHRLICLSQYDKQYRLKEASALAVLVATGIDVRKMQ